MALTLGDNFSYQGAKPLDARLKYSTVSEMKAVGDATMYDGCMAYCSETEKTYQWKSTNTVDASTGRWREFSSGGGGGSEIPQLSTMPAASAEYYDQYVQYIGTDTDRFRRFCYYHCVSDSQSGYRWDAVDNAVDGAFRYDRDTLELVYSYDANFRCLDKLRVKHTTVPTQGSTSLFTAGGAYTEFRKKQDVMQYSTMPSAQYGYLNNVVQFIGTTTSSYTQGHFYKCVADGTSYKWEEVEVGSGGGTSDYTDLENKPSINNVTLSGNKTSSQLGLQGQVQFSTMPTASSTNLGSIVQFIGTTSGSYTNGHFYKCVSDGQSTPTYSWEEVDVNKTIEKALTPQTLSVGNTSLTFQDSSIVAGCTIIPYTNKYGVVPTDITVTSGQAVLTFDAQETAISVYIGVR